MCNLFLCYRNHHYTPRATAGGDKGVSLNTIEEGGNESSGNSNGGGKGKYSNMKCYACSKMGHISYYFPKGNKGEE